MAMPAAHVVPREEVEKKGAGFSEAPIGTGPWVFESWAHDDVLRLTANRRYHAGPPATDGMEIRIIPETTTVIAELESGNIDWADLNEFPKPEFERFVSDPEWSPNVRHRPALITYYLALNNRKPQFRDPRVRRALNYAIDVAGIAGVIYPGEVALSHGPIPPELPGYRESGRPYGFHPDTARALLREAGAEDLSGTPCPPGGSPDDQARTATPAAAVRAGADYLVVGRPITGAADPAAAASAILAEIPA